MTSLLTLLDDIATTFDDVAVMTKVAMKKTSALMSDDLAVNAGVVVGVKPSQEIPMVMSIFWGSLLNKVYCLVGVLGLMAIYPPILKVILLLGGLYLSYEGAHKVIEKILVNKEERKSNLKKLTVDQKVKGAVRTDLILSIEIMVIANDSIPKDGGFLIQLLTLIAVGIGASVIIYGLVALLVKIDDLGLVLIEKGYEKIGSGMVSSMPHLMKGLGILGTMAMFLVGGGIIVHTFHLPILFMEVFQNLIIGILAGGICFLVVKIVSKIRGPKTT